jgi:Tfp pilus assembly protein PilF
VQPVAITGGFARPSDPSHNRRPVARRSTSPPQTFATPLLWGLGLVVLTWVAHLPALGARMIWDDDIQVFANPFVQAADGLRHFWLTLDATDYYPVTFTTHWFEWRFFGDSPAGYHAVNVALHAASAVVLWRVLARLRLPAPFAVAACFAVHPVTVASVAWIAELKNTLSLVLALGALLSYLRFEDERDARWYGCALGLFVAALLSKTSVVMLPALLLLLAWWRRGQVTAADVWRVVPFLAIAFVLGLVTVYNQHHNGIGAMDVRSESMPSRVAATGWVLWFYVFTDALPLRLSMIYPHWTVDAAWPPAWLPLLAWLAVGAVAWRWRATWGRPLFAAWAAFTILLLPVLGLVTMSFHRHALVSDHLQYVALVVPILLAVAAADQELRRRRVGRQVGAVATAAVVSVLALLTWQRGHAFADERTLWTDTLAKNPRAWGAYDNLSDLLFDDGDYAGAARDSRTAVELRPDAGESRNNLGRALAALGQGDEAESQYREAIRLEPGLAEPHNNLGLLLAKRGQSNAAAEEYAQALRLKPDYADAHNNLGLLLAAQGRDREAEEHYRRALSLRPGDASALSNLGNLLLRQGKPADAVALFASAVQRQPDRAALYSNLGTALDAQGKHDEAVREYATALRLQPDLLEAHFNMGNSLLQLGRFDEAVVQYDAVLRINPSLEAARQNRERAAQLRAAAR